MSVVCDHQLFLHTILAAHFLSLFYKICLRDVMASLVQLLSVIRSSRLVSAVHSWITCPCLFTNAMSHADSKHGFVSEECSVGPTNNIIHCHAITSLFEKQKKQFMQEKLQRVETMKSLICTCLVTFDLQRHFFHNLFIKVL